MVKHKSWVAGVTRVRGEAATRHGKLRLDKNERATPFPDDFVAFLRTALTSETLAAYPETEQLYAALAAELGLATDNLMLTAGSDGGIRHCFDLFVRPGDEVVVLEPTFAMVDVYCGLFDARRRAVGYDRELRLDLAGLLAAIGPATALVVLANPNSPTGTLIADADLTAILERAAAFDVPVLVDEAYHGFCRYTAMPLLAQHANLIVGRTFSKAYGLAGMRVGYLAAGAELAQLLYRFRPMYEVNALGVLAAMHALRNPQVMADYLAATEAGRTLLLDAMAARGLATRDTHTNFVHVDFGSRKAALAAAFDAAGILVRGGLPIPGYEGYLRISLAPPEAMERVVAVVDEVLRSASK